MAIVSLPLPFICDNLGDTAQRKRNTFLSTHSYLGSKARYPASVVCDMTFRDSSLLPLPRHDGLKGLFKRAKYIQKTARSIVTAKKSRSFEGKTFVHADSR